jgi:hypothetical protein
VNELTASPAADHHGRHDRHMSREGELEIEAEIEQIRSLPIDEIRALWRQTFKSQPPPALGKDMLRRMISYHIQEKALGGLTRAALRLLDDIGRGKPAVETAHAVASNVPPPNRQNRQDGCGIEPNRLER